MFDSYLREGLVKKAVIDRELAKSLVKIAVFRMEKARKETPAEENAFFIVENAYEALRELTDALLILEGYRSYSHEANIAFLKEFWLHEISMSAIAKIDRYRKIRNDIKYRGAIPSREEGKAAVEELKPIFELLHGILRRKMK